MIDFVNVPNLLKGKVDEVRAWLLECVKGYDSKVKNLVYHFVSDDEITKINIKHLEHSYATDIITFGYAEGKKISGDIYIGYETVYGNADDLNIERLDELCRVVSHGMLHLIGFDDHTEEDKLEMRREEENCLILRPKILRGN